VHAAQFNNLTSVGGCAMKCFLLWIDEELPALTDGINRAVHHVTNGLRTLEDLVVIASLQARDIVRSAYVSAVLKSTVNTMYKTHIKTHILCALQTQGSVQRQAVMMSCTPHTSCLQRSGSHRTPSQHTVSRRSCPILEGRCQS